MPKREPKVRLREARRPGRPRADDANQRERLLDAAVVRFTVDGIAATSLRAIAVEAGVTPALVNYYFGSKERLLTAFVAERLMPLVEPLRASLAAGPDEPLALAAAFVRALHAAVERAPWLPALWLREVIGERGALREVLIDQISPLVPRQLSERFGVFASRGALNRELDPRLLVVSLIGLTLFPLAAAPVWRRLFAADDVDAAALERHTLALLEAGLGGSR